MQSRATSMAPGICFLTASMAKQNVSMVSTGLDLELGMGGMVLFWAKAQRQSMKKAARLIR
jgi:hypothetical protein